MTNLSIRVIEQGLLGELYSPRFIYYYIVKYTTRSMPSLRKC